MKSFHCSLIALLSITCLGVLLGAGDVILRPENHRNDFKLWLGGHGVSYQETLAMTSIAQPVAAEARVVVDLPAGDFVYVQVLSSDARGNVQAASVNAIQVALDAVSRSFPLIEAVPTQEPLAPGYYVMSLMHKGRGHARVLFEIE